MEYYNQNLSIETIPLPLAGVLFSDSIHKIILKQHHIDAGVILFEKNPEHYFVNSIAGFDKINNGDEKIFSTLCIELSKKLSKRKNGDDAISIDNNFIHLIDNFIEKEKYNSFRVFKISDYLNTSGYWFMFNKNENQQHLTENPLDFFPGSNKLVNAIRKTIDQQSSTFTHQEIVNQWVKLLDSRDKETEEHTIRVGRVAVDLAKELRLSDDEIEAIKLGSLLHDIGKLVIPNNILHKPGPLSEEEWEIMKLHPSIAKELLSSHGLPQEVLDIPMYHHERWSGFGYPYKLKKKQIPLSARIFAIVDVWDALNSDRPYRKKYPKVKVDNYLLNNKGYDFDPEVVDSFIKLYGTDTLKSRTFFSSLEEKRISP